MREFFKGTKINIKTKLGLNNFGFKKISLILFMLIFFFTQIPAFAGEIEDKQQELYNLQKQIQDISNSLSAKKQEERTLANEIAVMDGQIQEIELQIQATQLQIDQTQAEIDALNQRIADLEAEIQKQKEVLAEHIRVLYEESQSSTLEIIASSDSFSDFVNRSEYLQVIQEKIKETIDKIKVLKAELDVKKQDLVKRQNELTELRNQQQAQRQAIESQRYAKQVLLDQTRGEEAAFQDQLSKVRAAFQKIQAEIWNSGNFVSQGWVNAGDIIGYMGNSGYSTGAHLHFEVRASTSTAVNPLPYFQDGTLLQPLPGDLVDWSEGIVTQWYGPANWGAYSFHTGIDLVNYTRYQTYSSAVRAAASGEIVARVTGYGNTYGQYLDCIYNGGGSSCNQYVIYGNYVIIRHDNGLYTLYGHLQ